MSPRGASCVILVVVNANDSGRRATRERAKPVPASDGKEKLRPYVPADILNVSFPAAVRGYDRQAVDAYVKRVNRVIAELKVGASPQAAVRHALDQASEKVEGLLEAAREAAEQITAAAQAEADETLGRAKAEAAQLVVDTSAEADRVKSEADAHVAAANQNAGAALAKAETEAGDTITKARAEAENILARAQAEAEEQLRRVQQEIERLRDHAEAEQQKVEADTARVRTKRGELLDDVRAMADALVEVANAAATRLPQAEVHAQEPHPSTGAAAEEANDTEVLTS
jgi:DivIVA domain-containing protein